MILLEDHDDGFRVSNKLLPPDPDITRLDSVTGSYFVANNLRRDELAKKLYEASCEAEQKILGNFLKILKTASSTTSLEPYYPQGHQAMLGKLHKIEAVLSTIEAILYGLSFLFVLQIVLSHLTLNAIQHATQYLM